MKCFISIKTCILLAGMATALLLAPACKAQSEVSPDHFDGTDSWATARSAQGPKSKQATANTSVKALDQKSGQRPALQLASSREVSKPANRGAAAVDRKRKPSAHDPEKK